jgi:hypothetical protein
VGFGVGAYGHDVRVCVTELDRCGASRNLHLATKNGAWVLVWAQTCGHNVHQLSFGAVFEMCNQCMTTTSGRGARPPRDEHPTATRHGDVWHSRWPQHRRGARPMISGYQPVTLLTAIECMCGCSC